MPTSRRGVARSASRALAHTAVVWVVALGGLYLGRGLKTEAVEPYLPVVSALIVAAVALWMIRRTRRDQRLEQTSHGHDHSRGDHHHHGGWAAASTTI